MNREVTQVFDIVDPRKLVLRPQVRVDRDEAKDAELRESIAMYGVLNPITVHKVGEEYHVIAGNRRTEMSIAADQFQVPIYIRPTDSPAEIAALQLVENIVREDLTLSDVANGVRAMYEDEALGGSVTLVAAALGKPKSWVSKMLTVTKPTSSFARKLLGSERLADLEIAYMLCRIEELSFADAELIYKEYASATRASVKAVLDRLTKAADETPTQPAAAESSPQATLPGVEPGGPADDADQFAMALDSDDVAMLRSILVDAVVPPKYLQRKADMLHLLESAFN